MKRFVFVSQEYDDHDGYDAAYRAVFELDCASPIHNPGDQCEFVVAGVIEAKSLPAAQDALRSAHKAQWTVVG